MKLIKAILVLLCVSATFVVLYIENDLSIVSLGIASGFYFIASAIHLLAHESGHLIGGLLSGYKLLCIQLGPVNIVMSNKNKTAVSWENTHGGQCIMIPTQVDPVWFKAYNMGGVYANILVTALSFLLLLPNSIYLSLLLIELIFVGFYKILVNLIPHKSNLVPNDGYVVKLLKRDKAIQEDYAIYLKLYANLFLGNPISPDDYHYEREVSQDNEEMVYYNEIQDILKSIEKEIV